jgi:glycosyltransferase involved in cell wall biosynthesis
MPGLSRGRVGMVLETGFPPDARVEREALALIEAGYEVFLLCQRYDDTLPAEEVYKGIHVTRAYPTQVRTHLKLPMTPVRFKTRFLHRGLYRSMWKRLTGMESDWRELIKDFVRQNRIDILHVHDLKLLKTSLAVATGQKAATTKVVADLHENYPALIGRLTQIRKGKVKGLEKQYWWEKVERKSLKRVNKVIVVVEEARDRILQYPTMEPEKVSIVRNVVDVEKFLAAEQNPLSPEETALMEGRFVIGYVGHINNSHRGIHTVLEALPLLIREIPNIFFVGAGSLRKDYHQNVLAKIIDKHDLSDYVHFTGFRDEIDFVPYIQRMDVSLCPHLRTTLTDTTFPNKIFLYGLFKRPVVVSSCLPLSRYARDTQSGVVYDSDNPQDLAKAIIQLYHDPALREQLGANGHHWVLNRYCWSQEKLELLNAYQTL